VLFVSVIPSHGALIDSGPAGLRATATVGFGQSAAACWRALSAARYGALRFAREEALVELCPSTS
jgi:hypothetical protein